MPGLRRNTLQNAPTTIAPSTRHHPARSMSACNPHAVAHDDTGWNSLHLFVVGCQYTASCRTSCWTICGVVGTGLLRDCQYTVCCSTFSWTIYGVVGTGVLWNVSTLCAVLPPPGLYVGWWAPVGCGMSVHCVLSTSSWTIWGVVVPLVVEL